MSAGIQGNPADLSAAGNGFGAMSTHLDVARSALVNTTNHVVATPLWAGPAVGPFLGAAQAVHVDITATMQGLEAGAAATTRYSAELAHAKQQWDHAHQQCEHLKAELATAKAKLVAEEAANAAASAAFAGALAAASVGFGAAVAAATGAAVAAPQLVNTAGLQAHIDHLTQEIQRMELQMHQAELEATQAQTRYTAAMNAAEKMWPTAFAVGGPVSGNPAVKHSDGGPFGWVDDATGWAANAINNVTAPIGGAVSDAASWGAHQTGEAAKGLWGTVEGTGQLLKGEYDMWFGNPNSDEGRMADAATEQMRHPAQFLAGATDLKDLKSGNYARWLGAVPASLLLTKGASRVGSAVSTARRFGDLEASHGWLHGPKVAAYTDARLSRQRGPTAMNAMRHAETGHPGARVFSSRDQLPVAAGNWPKGEARRPIQQAEWNFFKSGRPSTHPAGAQDLTIRPLPHGGERLSYFEPPSGGGSGKLYVKEIDAHGKTTNFYKLDYDPSTGHPRLKPEPGFSSKGK